jgi:exopolysaccharide production protein ExoQ
MPPSLALVLCLVFVLWLLRDEAKQSKSISGAIWIPLAWSFVLATRPLSVWLGPEQTTMAPEGVLEDKLIDKLLLVFLMVAGLVVLGRRPTAWGVIARANKWIVIYFIYLGMSVLWSDEPIVSFKRWSKDFGNLIMVLVVLSESAPEEAVRAFWARFNFIMVPLSVLVVKYYPLVSRKYGTWTHQPAFVGLTLDKNTLGMVVFLCVVSLLWMLMRLRDGAGWSRDKKTLLKFSLLLVMAIWLLRMAQSATAVSCSLVATMVLLALRWESIRVHAKRVGTYGATAAILYMVLQLSGAWTWAITQASGMVGRDPSLHGRTDIWRSVLNENTNPLIGVGFYSFWSAERNHRLSQKYSYQLGTAHNGYLETYLNSGLIGVALLLTLIAQSGGKIKRQVLKGSQLGYLRLTFLATGLCYNVTESTFDRLSPMWFALLLVLVEYPRVRKQPVREKQVETGHAPQGQSKRGPEEPSNALPRQSGALGWSFPRREPILT